MAPGDWTRTSRGARVDRARAVFALAVVENGGLVEEVLVQTIARGGALRRPCDESSSGRLGLGRWSGSVVSGAGWTRTAPALCRTDRVGADAPVLSYSPRVMLRPRRRKFRPDLSGVAPRTERLRSVVIKWGAGRRVVPTCEASSDRRPVFCALGVAGRCRALLCAGTARSRRCPSRGPQRRGRRWSGARGPRRGWWWRRGCRGGGGS